MEAPAAWQQWQQCLTEEDRRRRSQGATDPTPTRPEDTA
jgi:hypothetical protein